MRPRLGLRPALPHRLQGGLSWHLLVLLGGVRGAPRAQGTHTSWGSGGSGLGLGYLSRAFFALAAGDGLLPGNNFHLCREKIVSFKVKQLR